MNLLKNETKRHTEAYAYYLQLGGKRSYAKVAEKFGVSETSIRKWAQSFGWKERIAEANREANAVQHKKAKDSYISTIEEFQHLKQQVFQAMLHRLNSKKCSISELCKMLQAIKMELGEPTVIAKSTVQNNLQENPFAELWERFTASQQEKQLKKASTGV